MHGTRLQLALARRLLTTRRSYSAAGAIAAVAVCGVAIATAAIICVLSVFNGFHAILSDNLNRMAPDVAVAPARGKTFNADSVMRQLQGFDMVADLSPVLSDNALALYDSHELPVTLCGIHPQKLKANTAIDSLIIAGETLPAHRGAGAMSSALMSVGAASQMAFYTPGDQLLLFAPRRMGRINTANPAASFVTDSVVVAGVFESRQSELDQNTLFVDIELARRLFDREGEASRIDVSLKRSSDAATVAADMKKNLGENFDVKTREQQAEVNFRMVEIEKWVSFLLLFFILIIASFNIVSTLSMIVLDKQKSMSILHAIGMSRRQVGGVFFWESCHITALGGIIGMLLGLGLCLLQQHFGLIRLNATPDADMMISAYPVVVKGMDFLITSVPLVLIGTVTGLIASSFARSRI